MDRPLNDSKWLHFEDLPKLGKTRRIAVRSKAQGFELGQIRWYGRWRQYVFEPAVATIFNNGCLNDIVDRLGHLNTMQRNGDAQTPPPEGEADETLD